MSLTAYNAGMPRPKRELPEPLHTASLRVPESVWRRVRSKAGLEGKSANEWIAEQLARLVTDATEDAGEK